VLTGLIQGGMIFQPVQQSLGAEICGKNNVILTAQFGNGKFIPPIKMVMTGGWCKWHCFTHIRGIYCNDAMDILPGWWFQPFGKILVSWDYYSQYMRK